MELDLYQVDAFSAKPFGGNPAAVVPLESWLDDALLQAIALENNLSETAYFVRRGERYDLRWFTPAVEVDLCGHATLASAYVILTHLQPEAGRVDFESRSGPLAVTRDGALLTLDFPAKPPAPVEDPAVAEALGAAPLELLRSDKTLAVLADEAAVRAAKPDLGIVAGLDSDGLIVTAPGDEVDFVSRYFAPHAGIPEDPVTGSAHCVLTPYWAERLNKQELTARQVSARGGELRCRLEGDRVLISGRVAAYLKGRISI
ncbi:MAG: PhzF family phenazine biosynthesis protein [Rhodovibrionaceae bacterium]